MKKHLILYSLLFLAIPVKSQHTNLSKIDSARISYMFNLKYETASMFWPGFNSQKLYSPVIFYATTGTFLIQPENNILKKAKPKSDFQKINGLLFGELTTPIDTSNFNMQVNYDEDDSALLHYRIAVASISSLEISKQFVPNIKHTEDWISMVLHENFHLYQTHFKKFRHCQNKTQNYLSRDSLKSWYKTYDWYKTSILQEHKLLMLAIQTNNRDSVGYYLTLFYETRKLRYEKVKTELQYDIEQLEDMLERSEGVARYFELCVKRTIKHLPQNEFLNKNDSNYVFRAYDNYIEHTEPIMINVSDNYFYSTGLSQARILEKMKTRFQETMYMKNLTFSHFMNTIITDTLININ